MKCVLLKMPGPISQNENFYSNDGSLPEISWLQISFKSVIPFGHKKRLRILQLPIPYCVSLIMVTITSHIFTNIFQMVYFSAVKFTRGNEKNMSFLLIPKSQKVWKKSEAIRPGTFKYWRCQNMWNLKIDFEDIFWDILVFHRLSSLLTTGTFQYVESHIHPTLSIIENRDENWMIYSG